MSCQTNREHTLNLPHSSRYTACGTGHLTLHSPSQLGKHASVASACAGAVPTIPRAGPSGLRGGGISVPIFQGALCVRRWAGGV